MTQSIIVYGILVISLILLGLVAKINYKETGKKRQFWCWEIISILLIYSLISGIRYDVGVDYLGYLQIYLDSQHGMSGLHTFEFIFDYIFNIFSKSDIHFSFFFGFWAFIQLLFVLLAFRNKRNLYPYLILCMILLQYFYLSGGIRQAVVCCCFIFATQFITDKKLFKYLIFISISIFIHKSAIFLLPLYFILCFNKDFFPNKWITAVLILVTIPISELRIWENILTFDFYPLLDIAGYETYNLNKEDILTTGYEFRKGGRFYISVILPLLVALYSNKLKEYYGKDLINVLNLYFIGAITAIIFYSSGIVFRRVLMYFFFFDFIGTAYLLHYLSLSHKNFNFIIYVFVTLLCILYFYFFLVSNHHTQYDFYWDYITSIE